MPLATFAKKNLNQFSQFENLPSNREFDELLPNIDPIDPLIDFSLKNEPTFQFKQFSEQCGLHNPLLSKFWPHMLFLSNCDDNFPLQVRHARALVACYLLAKLKLQFLKVFFGICSNQLMF